MNSFWSGRQIEGPSRCSHPADDRLIANRFTVFESRCEPPVLDGVDEQDVRHADRTGDEADPVHRSVRRHDHFHAVYGRLARRTHDGRRRQLGIAQYRRFDIGILSGEYALRVSAARILRRGQPAPEPPRSGRQAEVARRSASRATVVGWPAAPPRRRSRARHGALVSDVGRLQALRPDVRHSSGPVDSSDRAPDSQNRSTRPTPATRLRWRPLLSCRVNLRSANPMPHRPRRRPT